MKSFQKGTDMDINNNITVSYMQKRKCNARVINIEKATFTLFVFSTSGGMGPEAMGFYKRITENI